MGIENLPAAKQVLEGQHLHWDTTFSQRPEMFGAEPSAPALEAADLFRREGKTDLLELGAGQGRDTLFFAREGFRVAALDYSQAGIEAITEKAEAAGLTHLVKAAQHDVREPLPFVDESFDAVYSHMLYCMALTVGELERLSAEVRRILRHGGLNVYTVRHTRNAHYGTGIHRGEGMYEVGGFIVHFFTKDLVQRLAQGYDVRSIDEFEEGGLPRKLYRVTLHRREGGL